MADLENLQKRIVALEERLNRMDPPRLGPKELDAEDIKTQDSKITELLKAAKQKFEEAKEKSPIIPVDRSQRVLADGSPVTPDHRELGPDGQQKGYVVLTAEERAKGFVRPVRRTYVHVGKPPEGEKFEYPIKKVFPGGCGSRTTMGQAIAETYARDPGFYDGTFCVACGKHLPLSEFVWEGTDLPVGS